MASRVRAHAFAASAFEVVACRLMAASARDDDAVQSGVDLAVATWVESVGLGVAGAGGAVAKRRAPAISATSLAAISDPKPRASGPVDAGCSVATCCAAGS